MIAVKCDTGKTAALVNMTPFQGNLKKRTEQDIKDLAFSLQNDGLLMPFALWQHDDKQYILDGHGRMQALVYIALSDPTVLNQEWPVLLIDAETEEEARKALLQITSTYGRFQKTEVLKFAAPCINYQAPVLVKAQHVVHRPVEKNEDKVLVRILVPKTKVQQLTALLKQVNEIEVI